MVVVIVLSWASRVLTFINRKKGSEIIMNTVEGYCVSDEELREEFIADLAEQVVQYAYDLATARKCSQASNTARHTERFGYRSRLSFDEWHKLLDEVVIVIASQG